jgi:hypothetical protein
MLFAVTCLNFALLKANSWQQGLVYLIATNGSEDLVFDNCRRHSTIHVLQDVVGSFPSKKASLLVTPAQ